MNSVVFDASAVLALLNDELGAKKVEARLDHALIGAVNLAEVLSKLIDAGMSPKEARETIDLLSMQVIDFDSAQALAMAALRSTTRLAELSLGDRACLALGLQTASPILTADKSWTALKIGKIIPIR